MTVLCFWIKLVFGDNKMAAIVVFVTVTKKNVTYVMSRNFKYCFVPSTTFIV